MTIKAFLLAAGFGTRLRPITDSIPKCLVPLGDKPILELWLRKLEKVKCESVLINTHYLSTQVQKFIDRYQQNSKINIELSHEKEILGTGGSLMSNLDYFGDSLGILIHADNFMYESLQPAIRQHQKCRPLMTMVTFISSNPQSCGIVEIDSQGIVQSYYEKSANPPGNMANGAIYIFDHRFVEYLRVNYEYKTQITDISSEIIPRLVGQIQSVTP